MKKLIAWLRPDHYCKSIFEIDLDALKDKGIKNLLIDLDNTLVPWGEDYVGSELMSWLGSLPDKGFKICVLSNNNEERASYVCGVFGVPYIASAKKPSRGAFTNGMSKLGADKSETAIIGDQMFTDILGGKLSGIATVLVVPLSKKEFWGTKIVRKVEWVLLKGLYGSR